MDDEPMAQAATVTIEYCTQCNWLLRAGWMAQELLSTFETELTGLTLVPGTGGVFRVTAGQIVVWNRATDGGFPDIVELKRRVRDQVAPERALGHADRAAARAAASGRSAGPAAPADGPTPASPASGDLGPARAASGAS